jgi:hypothetical protein
MSGTLGMVGYFSAIVRAPLTGVVLISEMTGNFEMLFMFLVVSLFAYAIPEAMKVRPIYEALMERGFGTEHMLSDDPLILDVVVQADSPMDGRPVSRLALPSGVLIVTRRRAGETLIPRGDSVLRGGDELTFMVNHPERAVIEKIHELTGMHRGAESQ